MQAGGAVVEMGSTAYSNTSARAVKRAASLGVLASSRNSSQGVMLFSSAVYASILVISASHGKWVFDGRVVFVPRYREILGRYPSFNII